MQATGKKYQDQGKLYQDWDRYSLMDNCREYAEGNGAGSKNLDASF